MPLLIVRLVSGSRSIFWEIAFVAVVAWFVVWSEGCATSRSHSAGTTGASHRIHSFGSQKRNSATTRSEQNTEQCHTHLTFSFCFVLALVVKRTSGVGARLELCGRLRMKRCPGCRRSHPVRLNNQPGSERQNSHTGLLPPQPKPLPRIAASSRASRSSRETTTVFPDGRRRCELGRAVAKRLEGAKVEVGKDCRCLGQPPRGGGVQPKAK